ncbi:hypothetical protein Tco_0996369 [Tanacetum coccineum]
MVADYEDCHGGMAPWNVWDKPSSALGLQGDKAFLQFKSRVGREQLLGYYQDLVPTRVSQDFALLVPQVVFSDSASLGVDFDFVGVDFDFDCLTFWLD